MGTPVAERSRPELAGAVGCFLNTLVLRTDFSGAPSFRDVLRQVREVFLGAYAHQDLPFERLVEKLQPERDLNVSPFFRVLFNFPVQVEGEEDAVAGSGAFRRVELPEYHTPYDLGLNVREQNGVLQLEFEYKTALFDAATVARLAGHLLYLTEAALADPDCAVERLPLLGEAERAQILQGWNGTAFPVAEQFAHERFETQAARTPDAIAVEDWDAALTYAALDARANALARRLRGLGVGPDVPVGICLPRSPGMLAAVLGVLKAGGAYLPLDPAYLEARLAYMLAQSGAPLLVTVETLRGKFAGFTGKLIGLDETGETAPPAGEPIPEAGLHPDHLAYIIYTSGSTGNPKGVAMPHRGLANLIDRQARALPGAARTLQYTTLGFDVSFQEIFATWAVGGTLVLIPEETRRDPEQLLATLSARQIERLWLPFIALQQLAAVAGGRAALPAHLRDVITAGEQLVATGQVAQFFDRLGGARLYNQYGPTETHGVTEYLLPPNPADWPPLPPIGRPIDNARIYILDSQLEPVPIGVAGELYIGGDTPARGYFGQPGLTAERFIPNPFLQLEKEKRREGEKEQPLVSSSPPPLRLYRTGDLVRYLPDGNIEFLGRRDQQIKLRGYRVELGEIEAALAGLPEVQEAVVVARTDPHRGTVLTGYLIPREGAALSVDEIKSQLRQKLPEYMVPAGIMTLEVFPLTPSGKVDRRALPEVGAQANQGDGELQGARDPLETRIGAVWEKILGVAPIGIDQDFFALGGHSLLAIRLFDALERELSIRLPLATLFRSPTVAGLAQAVRAGGWHSGWEALVPIREAGSRRPFFCVHGFGGGVAGYGELAALLGEDQPFWGLQARGLDGMGVPQDSVEAMAAEYVQAMKQVQPEGPYQLGGYCLGGTVAFEMARQLQAAGEEVALLALFETNVPGRVRRTPPRWHPQMVWYFFRNLPYWFGNFMQLGGKQMWGRIRRNLRVRGRGINEHFARTGEVELDDVLDDSTHVPESLRRLMERQVAATMVYKPEPYPGRVTVFRTRGRSLLRYYPPEKAWAKMAKEVEARMIAGAHHNILEAPHVKSLAKELGEVLGDGW